MTQRALIDAPIWAVAVQGATQNAAVLSAFSRRVFAGGLDAQGVLAEIERVMAVVRSGDLKTFEGLLAAQALALNGMFTDLAYWSAHEANLEAKERIIRLAFRAQAQSRATVETLALVQNGPTVFARQTNIAQGPQQVNNGPVVAVAAVAELSRARGNLDSGRSELLALESAHEGMDEATATAAAASHSSVGAVVPVDRPEDSRG